MIGMAVVFTVLVCVFLVVGFELGERHPLAADSLVWAAVPLSVLAVMAVVFHLVLEAAA